MTKAVGTESADVPETTGGQTAIASGTIEVPDKSTTVANETSAKTSVTTEELDAKPTQPVEQTAVPEKPAQASPSESAPKEDTWELEELVHINESHSEATKTNQSLPEEDTASTGTETGQPGSVQTRGELQINIGLNPDSEMKSDTETDAPKAESREVFEDFAADSVDGTTTRDVRTQATSQTSAPSQQTFEDGADGRLANR